MLLRDRLQTALKEAMKAKEAARLSTLRLINAAIVVIGLATIVIFCARGAATYFQAVILSRIGNSIIAENQRRLFDRLMQQNLGFFAERHSSEFLHRLSTGAASAMQVLNLLITAVGRDLLSLIGLAAVMVIQDPVMSISAVIIAPPARISNPAKITATTTAYRKSAMG